MDCLDFLFSDETSVPSPCFVLDEARLAANAAILGERAAPHRREDAAGPQGLMRALGHLSARVSRTGAGPLWGVCASSVDEARLAREEFGGEVHAFAAAWSRRQ